MQHFGEGLGRGSEVKTFTGSVVVGGDHPAESSGWEGGEIGLAGDEAAHPADGVFNAALLPGRVRIAEEGLDRQAAQSMMTGELGTVVEGDGLTK